MCDAPADSYSAGAWCEAANTLLATVEAYQRSLVAHHAIHNLSDKAIAESLGWTCQICARAQEAAR